MRDLIHSNLTQSTVNRTSLSIGDSYLNLAAEFWTYNLILAEHWTSICASQWQVFHVCTYMNENLPKTHKKYVKNGATFFRIWWCLCLVKVWPRYWYPAFPTMCVLAWSPKVSWSGLSNTLFFFLFTQNIACDCQGIAGYCRWWLPWCLDCIEQALHRKSSFSSTVLYQALFL